MIHKCFPLNYNNPLFTQLGLTMTPQQYSEAFQKFKFQALYDYLYMNKMRSNRNGQVIVTIEIFHRHHQNRNKTNFFIYFAVASYGCWLNRTLSLVDVWWHSPQKIHSTVQWFAFHLNFWVAFGLGFGGMLWVYREKTIKCVEMVVNAIVL